MKSRKIILITLLSFLILSGWAMMSLAGETPGKININTATAKELITLDGIGPGFAERIIEFREKNGGFAKIEEILKVPGIGVKIFEANKGRLTVQ